MTENNHAPFHIPVMTDEVLKYLITLNPLTKNKNAMFIDATLGGGGHTQIMLNEISNGIVIGLDLDPDAISYVHKHLSRYPNLYLFHCNYTQLDEIVKKFPKYELAGILFDLGVSSHQLSEPSRGFSFQVSGPLDMRFDATNPIPKARDILQQTSQYELAKIIAEYGEERSARKIARAIYQYRFQLNSTTDLAEIISKVMPARYLNKTLARVFQALRIYVNQELDNLKIALNKALTLMAPCAHLVVISYHSLEDRIAKRTLRDAEKAGLVKVLTKKPLRATAKEIKLNPKARSAHLRAVEKIKL